MVRGVIFIALFLSAGIVPAAAQDSASSEDKPQAAARKSAAKPASASALKLAPAKDPLADVPAHERNAIRAALLWSTGEYATPNSGDDPMTAAIKAFQKRSKGKITGALTTSEREALLADAKDRDEEFGWKVVIDPTTGIRVGLPTKMMPNAREAPQGMRWSSRHGDVQVETFRIKTTEALGTLFDQAKKEAARKVEYSVMRADNYLVSGLQGLKKFAVRAYLRNGEMRGFTISYDQAMEGIVAPVAVAMASAFAPFPERTAPLASLAKSVEYGSGLIVSADGHIVADRKLTEGCQTIVAAGIGSAERLAVDPNNSLALLRIYGRNNFKPMPLAAAAPKSADDLTLIGIADPHIQNGDKALSELRARLREGGALELRQPLPMAGYSGAAVLDKGGQVLGMMETRNALLASAEPLVPPVRLIPAETIREFLARHDVAAPQAGGDARSSVVRVICVRK